MVWKIFFCSEFPNIPEKSSRRRRWGKQTNAKCFAFQVNAINLWNNVLTFEKLKINDMQILLKYFEQFPNGRIFVNSPWIQHIEFRLWKANPRGKNDIGSAWISRHRTFKINKISTISPCAFFLWSFNLEST